MYNDFERQLYRHRKKITGCRQEQVLTADRLEELADMVCFVSIM